jgi:carboxyl-terminal processing protease
MVADQAVKIIRGPIGTTVTITVARQGETKPLVFDIVRDTINIPIIETKKLDNGIFKISLYSFSENSTDLFRGALREFVQSGDHKLLLDLRGNPGGYLDAAVEMASYFLPIGAPIVTEDYRGKQGNNTHRSLGYNVFANDPQFKMAILIDQGSASASEILSGALQQNNVAKLVGTRSFGKGSVQELMDLGNGAQLKVTIARWLTPNGSSISDGGLHADIEATTTAELARDPAKDPQVQAAVNYLLGR